MDTFYAMYCFLLAMELVKNNLCYYYLIMAFTKCFIHKGGM